ncbi:MAG: hypothetical protein KGP28_09945 [Bdellovibrionales bacterium]|nr:hypothetical protein [Bdellovibrionales bacterium]
MNGDPRFSSISMDAHIEYLLSFLQDEFRDLSDLRIHPVAPSGTRKSPDLPQDYDPQEGQVHRNRGVRVRISSREYFFPVEWVVNGEHSKVSALAREVREFHDSKER